MKTTIGTNSMLLNNELREQLTIPQQKNLQELLLTEKNFSVLTKSETASVCLGVSSKQTVSSSDESPCTKTLPISTNIAGGIIGKMMLDEEKCHIAEKQCEVTISNCEKSKDCILAYFNLGKYRYLQDSHQEALLHWMNAYDVLNSIDKYDVINGTNGITAHQFTEVVVRHIKLVLSQV